MAYKKNEKHNSADSPKPAMAAGYKQIMRERDREKLRNAKKKRLAKKKQK